MYEWDKPEYFILLAALPILFLGYWLLDTWKRRKRRKFAEPALLRPLLPDVSSRKYWLKAFLMLWVFAALSIAMVNPRVGTQLKTIVRKGVDVTFLLDISKSMLAEDVAPNRLRQAVQMIDRIIDGLTGDRIGIIIYAGRAYNLLPITTDYAAAQFFLKDVDTDRAPAQGTAIATALQMADKVLSQDAQKNRFVIVFSDGEDHGKNATEAAEALARGGIHVFTVGIGTTKGSPIPIRGKGRLVDYKKDSRGETVITRMHPESLRAISAAGAGKYIYGRNATAVAKYFKAVWAQADKNEFESKSFVDYKNQFQWFLGLALLLLVFDALVLERKTQWIERLNIFNEKP
ncbi:MAG: VWA domain-containing protein [Flavobacteriales bacterium]